VSKSAIGEQVENVAHESGTAIVALSRAEGTLAPVVDADGHGARGLFPRSKPAFMLASQETA